MSNLIANQNYWITLTAPGTGVTWNDNDVTSFEGIAAIRL